MTPDLKTYSRARAAIAAFNKAVTLDAGNVETFEINGRHAVRVTFDATPSDDVLDALNMFGADVVINVTPEDVDALADAALNAALEDEAPKKSKHGYINGVSRIESPCARLHALADAMYAEDPDRPRRDIMQAAQRIGITYGTARTQLQKWHVARRDALAAAMLDGEGEA